MSLTAKERILIRLYELRFQKPDKMIPVHITQRGISEDLRIHKTDVSRSLAQLEKGGFIKSEVGRVKSVPQRTRGYYIIEKGMGRARELEEMLSYDLEFELQEEAEIYRRLGRKKWRKGEHQQALKCFEDGLDTCRGHYPEVQGTILIDKGNVLGEMRLYDESIKTHLDALVLLKPYEQIHELCRLYNNLAVTYLKTQRFEKSMEYANMSLELNGTLKDKGHSYFVSAYALANLGDITDAIKFNEKGLNAAKKLQDTIMISGYWQIKGIICRFTKDYGESIECFDKALEILPKGLKPLCSEYMREKQISQNMMSSESK